MDESEHVRNKQVQFEQELLEAHTLIHRTVLSWIHDKWDADNIVQETELRAWEYMEERKWLPEIKNTAAFEIRIALNLRNDLWKSRRRDGWESLNDENDGQQYEALGSHCNNADTDVRKRIYLKELFKEVPWSILFQGLSEYELQIFYMHEAESMAPTEIAYEMRKDVHLVRYQLTKISAKVRYRAQRYLEETKRKSLFDREA